MREWVAKIYFLKTEEGGRKYPIATGYRPAFYFGDQQADGAILLDDHECISPGEESTMKIRMLHVDAIQDALRPNARFEVKEGLKVVGRGTVVTP